MYNLLNTVLTFVKNIKWTPIRISIAANILLVGAIIFLYVGTPTPKPEIIIKDRIIEVPGKDGKLDTVWLPKPYAVMNPLNKKLITKKDTIEVLNAFTELNKEREYNEVYEDSSVKIDIYTKVQGKLLKQAPKYTVKPYTIHIKDTIEINYNKPPTNKLLVGLETGLPLTLFTKKDVIDIKPVVKGSVYFQNKKSNVITVGFDTNKTIWAGYLIKL